MISDSVPKSVGAGSCELPTPQVSSTARRRTYDMSVTRPAALALVEGAR